MVAEISVDEKDLDILIKELQVLKKAGCRLKDPRQMWCSDWLRTKKYASTNTWARKAKVALSGMKAVQKMMEALTSSLKGAIEDITDQASDALRVVGFSSLPDDVLARIFELLYVDPRDRGNGFRTHEKESSCSSSVLASVSKRFRRIALHIPCLWEEVWNEFGEEWLSCLKGRTGRPKIFIRSPRGLTGDSPFLHHVHPTNRWESLHIDYYDDESGLAIFNTLCTTSREDFKNLRDLSIRRERYYFSLDDGGEEPQPSARLSTESDDLLADWQLYSVRNLELINVIPRKMDCPSLKDLTIELGTSEPFIWEIDALKDLLRWLTSIESLTLKLCRAKAPTVAPLDQLVSRPVRLFALTSLKLEIMFGIESSLLRRIMDMMDAPNNSKISLYMRYDSSEDEIDADEWITALFESPTGMIRTFPNVTDLDLTVLDVSANALPFHVLLRAVPRVRKVVLDIPHGVTLPMVKLLSDDFGCLKDIRSLRIKNCLGWKSDFDGEKLEEYFVALQERGELERFERLELEGCRIVVEKKSVFERLLGDRFIWKD